MSAQELSQMSNNNISRKGEKFKTCQMKTFFSQFQYHARHLAGDCGTVIEKTNNSIHEGVKQSNPTLRMEQVGYIQFLVELLWE